jgi:hypothetical protein
MSPHEEIATAIINKHVSVLGEAIAFSRARRVSGLEINEGGQPTKPLADPVRMLGDLISQYQELLGPAGISFSQDAASSIIKNNPELLLPESLQIARVS